MRAVIRYKMDRMSVATRQKTIEVTKNEPNAIVREFISKMNLGKNTYITTIRCRQTEYQWYGEAKDAGIY